MQLTFFSHCFLHCILSFLICLLQVDLLMVELIVRFTSLDRKIDYRPSLAYDQGVMLFMIFPFSCAANPFTSNVNEFDCN